MKIFPTTACVLALSVSAFAQQSATPAATQQTQAATAAPTVPPPANPITAAQIKEIEDVTGVADMQKRFIANAEQYYHSQLPPFIPQDVIDDLTKGIQNLDLPTQSAALYPKYVSTEDAGKIIEFYKTPAGKHYIAAEPELMSELQRSWVKATQQTVKDVVAKHKDEIEAAQKKYVEEHQQPKPSLNTPEPMTPVPPQKTTPSTSPQK